ncbi:MAG: hypothetical protein ACXVRI_06560 [Gaiellaceae bacterium]
MRENDRLQLIQCIRGKAVALTRVVPPETPSGELVRSQQLLGALDESVRESLVQSRDTAMVALSVGAPDLLDEVDQRAEVIYPRFSRGRHRDDGRSGNGNRDPPVVTTRVTVSEERTTSSR